MSSQHRVRVWAPSALALLLLAVVPDSRFSVVANAGSGGRGGDDTTGTLSISAQPQGVRAAVGTPVSLAVAATGTGTLSYQWYKGGAAIAGATGATYAIDALIASDAGRYRVLVSGDDGAVLSDVAVVIPTSGGTPVDVWDLRDGFNPADEISQVTFAYTVTLTGSSSGVSVEAAGLTASGTSPDLTTLTDGSNTVAVDTAGDPIAITSTVTSGMVEYVLRGTFSAGLTLTSASPLGLALHDVSIASANGPAISINSAVRAFVLLSGTSRLAEASPSSAAVNAALYSKGSLIFGGSGSLNVTAGAEYETNAVQVKHHVRLSEGTLNLKTRYNPSTKDVNTSNVYGLSATTAFVMDGGGLTATSADLLSGLATSVPAGWGRGVMVKGAEGSTGFIIVNGGILTITTYDKAMTAKWKCHDPDTPGDSDGDGRCDGNDPNPFVTVNGGTLTIRATGVPCDPADRMTYNATTCTSAASAEVGPEGIEAKSVFTLNGGTIDIEATDDAVNAGISYANPYGNQVVVNGGSLRATSTGNDGIDANARSSPGIAINGGVVIANGIRAPEEGLDADMFSVALHGGTVIATGGRNSTVDSASTAGSATISRITSGRTLAIWQGSSSAGSLVFAYQAPPAAANSTLAALVSSAGLTPGGSYTYFFTNASNVTCSEWFHGLCVGEASASYSSLGSGSTLTVR